MRAPLLALLLLGAVVCALSAGMQCLDNSGNPVDWWYTLLTLTLIKVSRMFRRDLLRSPLAPAPHPSLSFSFSLICYFII